MKIGGIAMARKSNTRAAQGAGASESAQMDAGKAVSPIRMNSDISSDPAFMLQRNQNVGT